jgi:hypothetical protein
MLKRTILAALALLVLSASVTSEVQRRNVEVRIIEVDGERYAVIKAKCRARQGMI